MDAKVVDTFLVSLGTECERGLIVGTKCQRVLSVATTERQLGTAREPGPHYPLVSPVHLL